ncbi:MAG: Gfo/Idh/MocA family protein [Kiritimatiellia bacterium]
MELNRRNFMKGAAVASAFLPSFNILHAEDATIGPKDDQINVALIGFGAEGRVLSASLVRIPGVRVRCVCDIWKFQQQQAKQFFKSYGHAVTTYEDYREMLDKEDKNIDAVVIATPDWMHCEHTCYCLRKGKHVYCEKEMSNRIEQAAEMCRVQHETGKLLQIGHQRRSNPRYRHCFEKIVPNMLGRVTTAYAQWNRTLAPFFAVKRPPKQEVLTKYGYENAEQFLNWRWFYKYGGGSMVDLGSHQIDLFIWAWGVPPSSVTAIGGKDAFNPPRMAYDRVMCLYEFQMPDGTKNEAYYQVISSNARGGFYEQFMGVDASLTIAEISARGNTVQRELRKGGLSDEQWQAFIDKGWILPAEGDKIKQEVTKDIAVDTRISAQANGNPIAVTMNKPAHMPHLENFFAACRHGTPLNCPADLAYESAVAVLAANASADSHQTYYFKKDEFKVPPRPAAKA